MSVILAAPLTAGFKDPARASREVFRLVLDAMAHPGSRVPIPAWGLEAPPLIPPSAAAILLTLLDHETPFWASPDLASAKLRTWIAFHCGAPMVDAPSDARFAIMLGGRPGPLLSEFAPGEDRYPERSATVLAVCSALTGGEEKTTLTGPGIEHERVAAPVGLRQSFWEEARQNHARFPLGIDLILCAANEALCLPRSTAIGPPLEAR